MGGQNRRERAPLPQRRAALRQSHPGHETAPGRPGPRQARRMCAQYSVYGRGERRRHAAASDGEGRSPHPASGGAPEPRPEGACPGPAHVDVASQVSEGPPPPGSGGSYHAAPCRGASAAALEAGPAGRRRDLLLPRVRLPLGLAPPPPAPPCPDARRAGSARELEQAGSKFEPPGRAPAMLRRCVAASLAPARVDSRPPSAPALFAAATGTPCRTASWAP